MECQQSSKRPFTVCIEGNIGSGKSTMLEYFEKYAPSFQCIPEPVDKWMNCGGFNLLELFYQDTNKWAMSFQMYVMLTLVEELNKTTSRPVRVMERSLASSRFIFTKNLNASGALDDCMYSVYNKWFDHMMADTENQVDYIIYLRTKPEVAHQRIQARNRPGEELITIDLLQKLHSLHEDWLMSNCPNVIVVDANVDEIEMDKMYGELVKQISTLGKIPTTEL